MLDSVFPQVDASVVARYDAPGPRYTSYPTVPAWRTDFSADDRVAALRRAAGRPLGLYLHVPFCESRCRFCGCNVVVAKDRTRAFAYIEQVLLELDRALEDLGDVPGVCSLHLGGGTPTFLTPRQLHLLLSGIRARVPIMDDAELALEAEPTVTTVEHLQMLRGLGFKRVSFGVQDLDHGVLQVVGRPQHAQKLPELVNTARDLGFESINFDLIYGLPGQTEETWAQSLDLVQSLTPDRLAIYGFAFLPEQRPHQKPLAKYPRPTGVSKLALFAQAYRTLVGSGYVPVGMDHFARPDDDLARAQADGRLGRSFQGYTPFRDLQTLGLGVSAISDLGGAFFQNPPTMKEYSAMLDSGAQTPARGLHRNADDERRRRIITDLMCSFTAPLSPADVNALRPELERLKQPEFSDLVVLHRDRVSLTDMGRVFVRNVSMVFDAYLASQTEQRFSRTV